MKLFCYSEGIGLASVRAANNLFGRHAQRGHRGIIGRQTVRVRDVGGEGLDLLGYLLLLFFEHARSVKNGLIELRRLIQRSLGHANVGHGSVAIVSFELLACGRERFFGGLKQVSDLIGVGAQSLERRGRVVDLKILQRATAKIGTDGDFAHARLDLRHLRIRVRREIA